MQASRALSFVVMCDFASQLSFLTEVTTWQLACCRKAYGRIAGYQSSRDWRDGDETYAGMVEVSRALMKVSKSMKGPKCLTEFPTLCGTMPATASFLLFSQDMCFAMAGAF